MKKYFLLWMMVLLWGNTFSQTITIEDQQSNQPIDLVTISSDQPRAFAITNKQGKAEISAFKEAELIEIRKLGYKTVQTNYTRLQEASFSIAMKQTNLNLDMVVVSATRWRQNTRDIPAKIASISPEEVAINNPQTAADLLSVSGKVYIQK
ncbi:MAG: hypothetical protein R6T91_09870, partial [Bacteroidales bacterium]